MALHSYTKEHVEEVVRKVVARHLLEPSLADSIDMTHTLDDYDLDSLDAHEIVVSLEEELDVTILDYDLSSKSQVAELVQVVLSNQKYDIL